MKLELHWLEEVDSTNLEAQRRLEAGCPEGTVLVAVRQTAGRGRFGREWSSPDGGMYLTVVLRPRIAAGDLAWISVAGGLAAAEELDIALARTARPTLKWPNDVLLNGRKVGGILGEARAAEGGTAVLLGIGLNLTLDPAQLPERPVFLASTVLQETGVRLEARTLAKAVTERLRVWYARLEHEGPEPLRLRFEQLSAHAGQPIEVRDGETLWQGRDAGLSENGALRIDIGRGVIEVLSGQISRFGAAAPEAR